MWQPCEKLIDKLQTFVLDSCLNRVESIGCFPLSESTHCSLARLLDASGSAPPFSAISSQPLFSFANEVTLRVLHMFPSSFPPLLFPEFQQACFKHANEVIRFLLLLQDFGRSPRRRTFIQEYILALSSQNDGLNVVIAFVKRSVYFRFALHD